MENHKIYLDYAATTPADPRVVAVMQPYFAETYGNPSSLHLFGQQAEAALEQAREKVAGVLGCLSGEVLFTSCGTESDNLALRGAALARKEFSGADEILTCRTEHHAVSKTAEQLERYFGFRVIWLPCQADGSVDPDAVGAAIGDKTALVSVMYANNEIGTINNIPEIARICHESGVLLHTDAVQAAAHLRVDVGSLGADLVSLGGHKFYGPKGVGALFVRSGTQIVPSQTGGGQEYGLRAGTHNVPYIVGFAEALQLAEKERQARSSRARALRDRIVRHVLEVVPEACLTGNAESRLPNHASFVFRGVDGNLLLTMLDARGYACSSGSACKTGNPEPSEVLTALGLTRDWSLGSLRVTVGVPTSDEDVDKFLQDLPDIVGKVRKLAAVTHSIA